MTRLLLFIRMLLVRLQSLFALSHRLVFALTPTLHMRPNSRSTFLPGIDVEAAAVGRYAHSEATMELGGMVFEGVGEAENYFDAKGIIG